jgi:hypothetical protein
VLCAIAQVIAPGWLTAEPAASLPSWVDGIVWSAVFGMIAGAVFGASYNAVLSRAA